MYAFTLVSLIANQYNGSRGLFSLMNEHSFITRARTHTQQQTHTSDNHTNKPKQPTK